MEKYLRQYAEPETAALDTLIRQRVNNEPWSNVLVIPACNETPDFLRPPPPSRGHSLLILVINEPDSARTQVSAANRFLASTVTNRFEKRWQSGPEFIEFEIALFEDAETTRDILLVDRFTENRKLPVKGGVGHARKIGADIAVRLVHQHCIQTSWIHCSDGDVHLPGTYFSCLDQGLQSDSEMAALVYPFRHCGSESADRVFNATQLYELSLRYYVAGMRLAGSPYAFHTIGSTMAVKADSYTKVRGFPKRSAGEDFYLLNKLAKTGSVTELVASSQCQPLDIHSRLSDRVPFGTGAAVNKIITLDNPVRDFRYYHPAVFALLRSWLNSLPALWRSGSPQLASDLFPSGSDRPQTGLQTLMSSLKAMGTEKALEHAFRQSGDYDQFNRQFHTWFDAFRTLKLIHALRDSSFPSISFDELQQTSIFARLLENDTELYALNEQITQASDLTNQSESDKPER